eukprot:3984-Heterococcus_DN1.PRE.1
MPNSARSGASNFEKILCDLLSALSCDAGNILPWWFSLFTTLVFSVTTAVYKSLFTAYYDNRLENRSTVVVILIITCCKTVCSSTSCIRVAAPLLTGLLLCTSSLLCYKLVCCTPVECHLQQYNAIQN